VEFRQTFAFQSDLGAVAAWLRRGEIEAAEIDCVIYDASKFKETLQQVRALTIEPPEIFQFEVVRLCAAAGVAVVFVPELPKTRTCGATRWLNPNKALIQLSLRYKTNDHLWFAFFHEAGHILLHGKRNVFLIHLTRIPCRVGTCMIPGAISPQCQMSEVGSGVKH
jgi:hypothetical protein